MDKSWMQKGRGHHDYIRGCDEFLTFAWANRTADLGENIYCPCISCNNGIPRSRKLVRDHILRRGITRTYTCWTKHGEAEVNVIHNEVPNATEGHDMHGLLRDSFPASRFLSRDDDDSGQPNSDGESQSNSVPEEPNVEAQKFYKLLKEAETPLYPGCTTTSNLSFLVSLLHLKCSNKMSNKAFDEHLSLLSHTYPESNIPKNFYEAKKKIRDLGMECIKIDACPNDCMLYWKGLDREKNKCDVCGESRWIKGTGGSVEEVMGGSRKIKRKAAKVLRYFPLKPRLQRLFMCSKTSKEMIWQKQSIPDDVYKEVVPAATRNRKRARAVENDTTSCASSGYSSRIGELEQQVIDLKEIISEKDKETERIVRDMALENERRFKEFEKRMMDNMASLMFRPEQFFRPQEQTFMPQLPLYRGAMSDPLFMGAMPDQLYRAATSSSGEPGCSSRLH